MKKIVLIALLMVNAIRAAELASVPQLQYSILPRDICSLIAKYKTGYEIFDVENREDKIHFNKHTGEQLRMSATWNTATLIPDSHLMEHQLWIGYQKYRFDNDTTHDCNEFLLEKPIGLGAKIMFDGPNNDTDSEGKIEGRAGGVILVGKSDDPTRTDKEKQKTEFFLFKQHNIDVRNYNKGNLDGIQQKVQTNRTEGFAFVYYNFPYVSEPLFGQSLDFCALAPHARGLVATTDASGVHHLHVFNFKHVPNITDPAKPDQSFEVKMLAHASNIPLFSRLAWIYGRTLLGITNQNELYVVALKEENGKQPSIECFKQKTEKKFKNFCLRRPDDHHEVFLCDTENKLYTANLKRRNVAGAFFFKLIHEKKEIKEGETVKTAKTIPQLLPVDRVWAYDTTVMTMELKSARCSLFKTVSVDAPHLINKKLHEMKNKYDEQKAAVVQLIDNNPVQVFEEYTLTLAPK